MSKRWTFPLALGLLLGACGGDPMKDVEAALAARDLPRAEQGLDGVLKEHPGLKVAHLERFVLCRFQALQGDPAAQDAYRRKAIDEYEWLVKAYQLTENYQDMEGSLQAKPEAAADFATAHRFLYN